MIIRPKTKRRLLILLVGAALFSVSAAWLYSYRIAIAERRVLADKQIGLDAYQHGDYQTALDKLTEYINHQQKEDAASIDPQALLAYANARAKLPTKNEDYIVSAVTNLRRYCVLVPGDLQAREQLVEMEAPYATYIPDAVSRSNDILRDHPDDLVALKAVGVINFREQKLSDALPAVEHYLQLSPTDLELQKIYFQIMHSLSRPGDEMQKHADDLLAKYPDDPRFKIVKALAYYYGRNPMASPEQSRQDFDQYHSLILTAAKADPPSAQFARTTIALLDGLSEYGVASDLLDRASAKFNDPDLTTQSIVRLWETRKYGEVVARLKNLDATSPNSDASMMAYKALSLYQLGKDSDAAAIVAQLDARGSQDHIAYGWAETLKAQYQIPPQDLKTRLAQYQDAQSASSENGYIAFLLGDAYAQMDESELATAAFRQAAQEMPSWAEPHVRLADLLVDQGQGATDEAARAAESARLAGTNASGTVELDAAIVNIKVSYARLLAIAGSGNTAALLSEVSQLQNQLPNEPETLPIYVALLAQTGQRDVAIDAIHQACKNPGAGGEDLLLNLVETSQSAKLGMEETLYTAIESKFGVTPRLAYARAIELLHNGRAGDGLAYLMQNAPRDKTPGDAIVWDRAICQYREAANDPAAASAWKKLGEKYPQDVMVQSTILSNANSAWNDRAFIRQTIDRLHTLTGDSAIAWKTFQARWLLAGDGGDAAASQAITLLTSVIAESPQQYLPRVLLATAYDRLKDTSSALDQWRQAADMQSQNPQAQFAYLQALHAAGKSEEVQVVFDHLAGMTNLPPDLALASATIIAAEGDMQRAENMLLAYPNPANPVLHDATLAKVYRLENRPSDAAAIYFTLATAKSLDVSTIREAADFFGAENQLPEAQKFLDRLSDLQLPGGQRQIILAEFQEEHGDPATAAKLYDDAVKSAGDDPAAAIQQIGFYIRQNLWGRAGAAAAAAAARGPTSGAVAKNSRAPSRLCTPSNIDQLQTLIEAITADPRSDAAMETLALATDSNSTLAQDRALMDKYPDFEPIYELTSRRLMAEGNPSEAVAVARKAMGRFPRSVNAARTTAEVNAASGNWNDAMIAGREWRQRVTENTRPADEFIAMADLAVQQPADAIDRLAPYIDSAKAQPDQNQTLISTYAQALLRAGRQADAVVLLQPLTKDSAKWRMVWLDLAPVSFSDAASSDNWISQIKPSLNADSMQEQGELAQIYVACGEGQNNPQDFAAAMDTLKPFLDSGKMSSGQWLTYAGAAADSHDLPSAEQAYRQALKLDPTSAVAQNNLADVLRQIGTPDGLKEAETLATAVISAHPADPQTFNFYDTLARVLLKENRPTDAIATFEKGNSLNPKDLDILIGLASTCANNSQVDAAVRYLSQIDSLMPPGTHLSDELQAELAATREIIRKGDGRSSVSGTDFSPGGK